MVSLHKHITQSHGLVTNPVALEITIWIPHKNKGQAKEPESRPSSSASRRGVSLHVGNDRRRCPFSFANVGCAIGLKEEHRKCAWQDEKESKDDTFFLFETNPAASNDGIVLASRPSVRDGIAYPAPRGSFRSSVTVK